MLYLVRHGRTTANERGLLQGRLDPPLDEVGRAQAEAIARMIGRVDDVIASPLARAQETAEYFGKPVTLDDRWLEFLDEQATSDDPEVRFATAIAYGVIGSEDGLDAVVALLADDDPEVVAAAINALGDIGGDLAIERLKTLAASDNPILAEAATDAIENASIFQQPDLLRRELQDDD